MYAEDRVLVGVINRKCDLDHAQHDHWYRIPQARLPKGIHAEYMAFFLSRSFAAQNGAIHYYARRTGHELVRRRDLLPDESTHRRADDLYFKVQLGELRQKVPPIGNPTHRSIAFIYTTWDRFISAEQIGDLYSTADHFVDRVFFALQNAGIHPDRLWEAENTSDDGGAQLRILCERGEIIATTAAPAKGRLHLSGDLTAETVQQVIADIRARIAALGGPLTLPIPLEH